MLNVVLSRNDRIESLLPLVERAMASGEVCRVQNISQLGAFDCVTQTLAAMVEELLDGVRQCRVQPGFRLLSIDEQGVTHTLLM